MPHLRPDRLATLYFFHPLRKLLGRPSGVPILMYHSISADPESHRSPYYRTCTDPRTFARQMEFLSRGGYRVLGTTEAVRILAQPRRLSEKVIALTFDDGYRDFYDLAFPVLARFGFAATVYLPTAYIGERRLAFNSKSCLTWSEVRELRSAGVEFGSHTVTHPQLQHLSHAGIRRELRASREEIEARLGEPVLSFSYPYKFPETDRAFCGRLREDLSESGYRNGVSTVIGVPHSAADPFFLERLPVNSADDAALLRAKLAGAYNWLHAAQFSWKRVRTAVAS